MNKKQKHFQARKSSILKVPELNAVNNSNEGFNPEIKKYLIVARHTLCPKSSRKNSDVCSEMLESRDLNCNVGV